MPNRDGADTVGQVRIVVISGDDAVTVSRQRQAALEAVVDGSSAETVDAADGLGAVLSAARTPSLWAPVRVIALENLQALSVAELSQLASCTTDVVIVARAERALTPTARKALAGGHVEFIDCPLARKAGDQRRALVAVAREMGVRLDARATEELLGICGGDVAVARSALWQLSIVGIVNPTASQLRQVAAYVSGDVGPWVFVDALVAGDVAAALGVLEDPKAAAVLAVLAKELAAAGLLCEGGRPESGFRGQRSQALARRLGPKGLSDAWRDVADAVVQSRSGVDEADALRILVTNSLSWGGERAVT